MSRKRRTREKIEADDSIEAKAVKASIATIVDNVDVINNAYVAAIDEEMAQLRKSVPNVWGIKEQNVGYHNEWRILDSYYLTKREAKKHKPPYQSAGWESLQYTVVKVPIGKLSVVQLKSLIH